MNIPNDGGWGKPDAPPEQGSVGFRRHISGLSGNWLLLACLALTATLCFGLGLVAARQSQPSKDPLWIEHLPPEELPGSISTSTPISGSEAPIPAGAAEGGQGTSGGGQSRTPTYQPAGATEAFPQTGNYVASKTGTKYYLPTCGTAKRIKEENKVWFATKQQAEAAGYEPGATCKGL